MNAPDRRTYVGGGAIGAVLNVSPHQTALELWEAMTSDAPPAPDPERERFFRRRKQMEPIVVRMLEEDHGITPTKVSLDDDPNRYRDPINPAFAAEIDFETVMTPALAERFPRLRNVPTGEVVNGEIKALNPRAVRQWGEADAEELPQQYAAQALWGLGVTDRPACLVCPLFGIDSLPVYPVLHDPQIIGWMRREAEAFLRMVRERTPPAPKPRNLDDLRRWAAKVVGVPVDLDAPTHAVLETIFALRAEQSAIKRRIDDQEEVLFEFVRRAWGVPAEPDVSSTDDAVLRHAGSPVAVWRRQTREDVDVKRLRAEDPMTFYRFKREGAFRVLARPPKGSR